jgi:hypothetical protein
LKNFSLPVFAMALANIVLPVPGGPNINTPFQAFLIPWKKLGRKIGSNAAY